MKIMMSLKVNHLAKYSLSIALLLAGLKFWDASNTAGVPICSDQNIIEKLKITVSASIAGEEYSANKVDSLFDVREIDKASHNSRSCRAGLRAEGSGYGYVNYIILRSAEGSKEKIGLNVSFE